MDFTGPWPTVGTVGTAQWLSHIATFSGGGQFDMNATSSRNVAGDLFTQNVNTQTYKALNTFCMNINWQCYWLYLPLVLSLLMLGTLLNLGSPKGIVVPTLDTRVLLHKDIRQDQYPGC